MNNIDYDKGDEMGLCMSSPFVCAASHITTTQQGKKQKLCLEKCAVSKVSIKK